MQKKKRLIAVSLSLTLLIGIITFFSIKGISQTTSNVEKDRNTVVAKGDVTSTSAKGQSKNLIVLIGDGMGPPQITLSRIYGQKYENIEKLALDQHLIGLNSTHADDSPDSEQSGIVTDSAASGTAFATGNKTYNGAVSVTNEEVAKPVASVIEAAQLAGKATGIVSTARITHATPAVYAAHVRSRNNENAIASQYAASGVDVLLGGGERHFVAEEANATFGEASREDGIDLVKQFKENGYEIVFDKQRMEQVKGNKLLGLFNDSHIPYNLDRDEQTIPTLKEQLEKAISILEKNEKGFVLMVEGGRIDHAGHANDLHSIAKETLEFDEAFQAAIDYAKKDGSTSVIATADHETGGLTIGSQNIYDAYFDVFQKVKASSEVIGEELKEANSADEIRQIVKKYTEIDDLTEEEIELIMSGNLPDGSPSSYEREGSFNAVIAKRAVFGWTGHGHSGVDVGVYGYGPAAELLRGFTDNTDFAKAGATALGLDLGKATATLQEKYLYPKFLLTSDKKFLLPVESLSEELGFTVKKDNGVYTLEGAGQSVKVEKETKKLTIEQVTYPVEFDGDQLYVTIDVIDYLTESSLEWDELSERIVVS